MYLKQSTTVVISFGPFLDRKDGVTLKTALVSALDNATTGIMLSKNGATLAVRHAAVTASTYDAHGCYKVTLDQTDTGTLGHLRLIYTSPTVCLPVWRDFVVLAANVYDALVAGSDALQIDAIQVNGTAQTAGDLAALATAIQALLVNLALTTGAVATDGGNSATAFKTTLSSAVNDYWKDALMLLTSGALAGQVKKIGGYDGTTKVVTVAAGETFTATPADGVTFVVINR